MSRIQEKDATRREFGYKRKRSRTSDDEQGRGQIGPPAETAGRMWHNKKITTMQYSNSREGLGQAEGRGRRQRLDRGLTATKLDGGTRLTEVLKFSHNTHKIITTEQGKKDSKKKVIREWRRQSSRNSLTHGEQRSLAPFNDHHEYTKNYKINNDYLCYSIRVHGCSSAPDLSK